MMPRQLRHLGLFLYEYLGEEYPEVLGRKLSAALLPASDVRMQPRSTATTYQVIFVGDSGRELVQELYGIVTLASQYSLLLFQIPQHCLAISIWETSKGDDGSVTSCNMASGRCGGRLFVLKMSKNQTTMCGYPKAVSPRS